MSTCSACDFELSLQNRWLQEVERGFLSAGDLQPQDSKKTTAPSMAQKYIMVGGIRQPNTCFKLLDAGKEYKETLAPQPHTRRMQPSLEPMLNNNKKKSITLTIPTPPRLVCISSKHEREILRSPGSTRTVSSEYTPHSVSAPLTKTLHAFP